MRVLAAIGYFGRFGEADGVITTYSHLIESFKTSDIDLDLLCYAPEDAVERLADNVRLICHRPRLPLPLDAERNMDLSAPLGRIARMLMAQDYDLIQSSTPDPLGVAALMCAKRKCLPFLVLYHTALEHYAAIRIGKAYGRTAGTAAGAFMRAWVTRYYRSADLLLTPSNFSQAEMEQNVKCPVGVLSRGVDTEAFHPGKRDRTDSRVRVLFVGRVAPEKNLSLLADVLADRRDVDLMIVGEGPMRSELQKDLPRATLPGKLTGDDLYTAYASADVFAFPSRTDTLGNVVLEAMASGVPAVVTDAMGPKELVTDNVTGLVARSDGDFAQALNRLIDDRSLRQRMGAAAREEACKRTWQSIFERLVRYYEYLLAPRREPQRSIAGSALGVDSSRL